MLTKQKEEKLLHIKNNWGPTEVKEDRRGVTPKGLRWDEGQRGEFVSKEPKQTRQGRKAKRSSEKLKVGKVKGGPPTGAKKGTSDITCQSGFD